MSERHRESDELARRLKETREYLGLSQQYVSDQTGIARSAISDIERGARKVASLELRRLSRVYGYPVSYFIGEAEPVENEPTVQALARLASDLSAKDREEVLRFATYLRHAGREKRS